MLSSTIRKTRKLFFNPKLFFKDMITNIQKKEKEKLRLKQGNRIERFYDLKYISDEEYKNKIIDNSIRILSFDIFDTLITRPLEDPFGVFSLLAMRVQEQLGLTLERFVFARHNADILARKQTSPHEASFQDRYKIVQQIYNLSNDETKKIMDLEIEIELELCKPRIFGQKLFTIAKKSCKQIILISDMYFTEDIIRKMLVKCNYPLDGIKIFISCECGTYKGSDLYTYVAKKLSCHPRNILHTGDSIYADVNFAKKHGYQTYQIQSSRETMLQNNSYKILFPQNTNYNGTPILIESVFSGLLSSKLFDTPLASKSTHTLFLGKRYNLGYAGVGPALFSYVLWLHRIAIKKKISHLYFLSREGLLLQQAYDILFKKSNDYIQNTYTYNSTRAIRVASLMTPTDVSNLAIQPFITGVSIDELMNHRFGIKLYDNTKLKKLGISSKKYNLQNNTDDRIKFLKICKLYMNEILDNAKYERANFLKYLHSIGMLTEEHPGLVDIGWSANSIVFYKKFIQNKLNIFYYCAFQNAVSKIGLKGKEEIELHSFAGHFFKHPGIFSLPAFSPITEVLFCSYENSFAYFDQINDELKPVFREEEQQSALRRKEMVQEVHRGALDFIKDMDTYFYNFFGYLYPSPVHAETVYASFLNRPTFQDAMLLKDIAYENMFSGISEGYVIAPSKEGKSSWHQGHSVIYSE